MTPPARTVEEAVAWLLLDCDNEDHASPPGYVVVARGDCEDCLTEALREQREAGRAEVLSDPERCHACPEGCAECDPPQAKP